VVDDLAVGGRAVGYGTVLEIGVFAEKLDRWGEPVDLNLIAQVQSVALD
jgi:hypothetical protein